MNAEDKKDLKKIFQDTLMEFWDKALEPALNKLYGRVDGLEGRLDGLERGVNGLRKRLGGVEGKLGRVEQKVIVVDQRTQSMDKQLEAIEKTLEGKADDILVTRVEGSILTRIDKLEKNIGKKVGKHAERLEDHEKRITKVEKASPLSP